MLVRYWVFSKGICSPALKAGVVTVSLALAGIRSMAVRASGWPGVERLTWASAGAAARLSTAATAAVGIIVFMVCPP